MNRLDFLTPEAAVVAFAVAAPLVAFMAASRRGERARAAIGLPAGRFGATGGSAVALVLLGAFVGLAAAQPVLHSREQVRTRTDAAAWVVVDTSRSMLAAGGPRGVARIVRARRAALSVRAALGDVPVGVASLSDRVLPHLFPSSDRTAFANTIAQTVRPGHPQPAGRGRLGTDLAALAAVPRLSFFEPAHRRRAVLVLTDGESPAAPPSKLGAAFRSAPRTALAVVVIGRPGERVYDARGRPEAGYQRIAGAVATVRRLAAAAGGRAFGERDLGVAARTLQAALGESGPTDARGRDERRRPLAPFALGAAALPLAWLLRRRNLP